MSDSMMCEAVPETFTALERMLKPMNSTKDISECGIPESTLAYWRGQGIGPRFVKVGRIVMYPREEVMSYFRSHLYQRTGEYVAELDG